MGGLQTAKRVGATLIMPLAKRLFPYRFSAFNLVFSRFCNASCRMCVKTHYDDKQRSRVYLDQGTLTNVLGQLKSMGARDIAVFPMGEPLVHPRFANYIDQIVSAGFRVIFSTNGELVHKKHHGALGKVANIGYSIEGHDDETVRHYRGVSFEKVERGLHDLRNAVKHVPMVLRTTLYRNMDYEYLDKFMARWAPYFDELVVTPANPPHLYHMQLPDGIDVSPDEFFTFERDSAKRCTIGKTGVAILPNGDVSECTEDYSARFIFGNINQRSLRDIIESRELAEFQDKACANSGDICGNCNVFYSLIPEHQVLTDEMTSYAHKIFAHHRSKAVG